MVSKKQKENIELLNDIRKSLAGTTNAFKDIQEGFSKFERKIKYL